MAKAGRGRDPLMGDRGWRFGLRGGANQTGRRDAVRGLRDDPAGVAGSGGIQPK